MSKIEENWHEGRFNGYWLIVQWDDPDGGQPLESWLGRKSYRQYVAEE